MKKFVAVISILALLFCLVSASAEEIDLESMETQELIDLQAEIQKLLLERDPMNSAILYPGKYSVGEDVEPGSYFIQSIDSDEWSDLCIQINDGVTEEKIEFQVIRDGKMAQFRLEDGQIMVVSNATGALIKH